MKGGASFGRRWLGPIGLAMSLGLGLGPGLAAEEPSAPSIDPAPSLNWRYQYRKVRHPDGFWTIELPIAWNMPVHGGYASVFYSEPIALPRTLRDHRPPARSLMRLDVVLLDRSIEQLEAELMASTRAQGMALAMRSTPRIAGRSAVQLQFLGGTNGGQDFDRTLMTLVPVAPRLNLLLVGAYNPDAQPEGAATLDRIQRSIELFFDRPADTRTPAQRLLP